MKTYVTLWVIFLVLILLILGQIDIKNIDTVVSGIVAPISAFLAGVVFFSVDIYGHAVPVIVFWLVFASLIATFYFGFINIRAFGHAFDLVRGRYTHPKDTGEVSHFQALATALSGTVGLGNIASRPHQNR